jgi:hypothetical protein
MSSHVQFCFLRMLEYLLNQQVLTFYGSLILQPMDLINSVNPLHLNNPILCSLGLYFTHNKVILKVMMRALNLDGSLLRPFSYT